MKRKNTLKNGKFGQISQENNMKTLLTIVAPRRLVCKNILILLALSIFVLLFFLSQTIKKEATNINKQKIIAAYVPEYSYEYAVENIIFFGPLIDEIILFSVTISEEGRVLFHPQSSGYEIKKVKQLGTLAKANGIKKVLLTIGGGGRSSFFPEVSSCPFKRTTLANELFNVCKQNNLDGIDFDWEGYMSGEDYSNYNLLIQEVKDLFNKKSSENFQDPFMVTVALHYWQTLESSTIKKIDRVHVMLYDLEGRHSTLSATEALIQSMLQKGRIPSKKLLWGIPAYGRCVGNNYKVLTYKEVVENFKPAKESDEIFIPALNCLLYYNGLRTVFKKLKSSQALKLSGVFLWELGQDSNHSNYSLLARMREVSLSV